MLFKPTKTMLWDTFILPHDGKFYLYYLSLEHRAWDGYGLAISDDLVHWEDRGVFLQADPTVSGMGSGSVWRASDRWILNYSYGNGGSQRIYFAESDDLIDWRPLPREIECAPDPRWYECTRETTSTCARWDNIWAVPQEDGSFLGFVVACGQGGPAGANGVVGMVSSPDGVHWQAEPPVSLPCGMVWAEASCYFRIEDRHYLLVGSNTCLGARFDPVYSPCGKAGGMYVMIADDIRGPYRFVQGDPLLLGARNAPPNWVYIPTYYARVMEWEGQFLLYHHWLPRANFVDAWLGTVKVLREDAPGRLSLHYWPGNEALKGKCLFNLAQAGEPAAPYPQAHPIGAWKAEDGTLTGTSGATSLAYFPLEGAYADGVVIEAEITVHAGAAGLFFGSEQHGAENVYDGIACLLNARGLYEFGRVIGSVAGPTFFAENAIERPVLIGRRATWRLLLRSEFVEMYVDDALVQCYGFSTPPVMNIGFFLEMGEMTVQEMRVYAFS